jgi:hypothetical protein
VRKPQLFIALFIVLAAALNARPSSGAPSAQATISQSIFIQSPREGQALQGVEIIEGKIRGEGLIHGKISFSYAGMEDPTWFFVADIEPEESDGSQTSFKLDWDTTQITDGDYNLRVVAEYRSGPTIFELIPNLRIRNHSPVETSTPAPVMEDQVTITVNTPTIQPLLEDTLTPLPANPVVIKSDGLSLVLAGSVIIVLFLFMLGGVYWFIKIRE